MTNLSLLVHSFNKYERYWDGFLSGFKQHVKTDIPCYFGTDVPGHAEHDFGQFKILYSGHNEWSDRLINLLNQIETDYLLYWQEDMWAFVPPPDLEMLMQIVIDKDLCRLQISPVVQFYSLTGSKNPLYFHWKSKYLMSHQPSIWKKSFLLECLKPNENPWVNEYRGTQRLNKEEFAGKIAIYPHKWFTHESVKEKIKT